jgi:hypothetical protein
LLSWQRRHDVAAISPTTRIAGCVPWHASGSATIIGAAGGQTATLLLGVGAREQSRPIRVRPTTAGERATL